MKVRNGFVSNSSTTSFCLYGVRLETDILQKFGLKDDDDDTYDSVEQFQEAAGKVGLTVYYDYDCQSLYVGRGPEDIGDNETGKQFKADTQQRIDQLTGTKEKCEWMAEEIAS